MKPLRLFLKGFVGIAAGLHKSEISVDLSAIPDEARLVVLAGYNGVGKSTILDNLQPYRIMPSRCEGLKPSAFSYWDELSEPLARKQLDWQHNGMTYRSDLVFKTNGKTRSQSAYLLQQEGDEWLRVTLADGTTSDGSTATYDRCVENILGRPEVFFSTAFSAWKRKLLGSYATGDIKSLLTVWLGHDFLLQRSAQAREVVDQLKQELAVCQSTLRDADDLQAALARANSQVSSLTVEISRLERDLDNAQVLATESRNALVRLEAQRDGMAQIDAQRAELEQHIVTERNRFDASVSEIRRQLSEDRSRIDREASETDAAVLRLRREVEALQQQLKRLDQRLSQEADVASARKLSAELQQQRTQLTTDIDGALKDIVKLRPVRASVTQLSIDLGKAEADGVATKQRHVQMMTVAALAERVPCADSPLQEGCELLKDALTAKGQLDAVVNELTSHRARYTNIRTLLKAAGVEVEKLDQFEQAEEEKRRALAAVNAQIEALAPTLALGPLITEAREQRPTIVTSIGEKEGLLSSEVAKQQLATGSRKVLDDTEQQRISTADQVVNNAIAGFKARLAALPPAIGIREREEAQSKLDTAEQRVAAVKHSLQTSRARFNEAIQQVAQAELRVAQLEPVKLVHERLGAEVAAWELAAQSVGKDGLVAYSIDDAGPEISDLANELINKCYDGNFVVRFETQTELRSGQVKEGFEIMVRDTQGGKEKPIDRLSGGQEVFVNECITRGVALYLALCGSSQFDTLFSDETDGPLDESKKRQFMRMKRKVLELGNYSREIFVTQSKEVQGLADYVIDVAAL